MRDNDNKQQQKSPGQKAAILGVLRAFWVAFVLPFAVCVVVIISVMAQNDSFVPSVDLDTRKKGYQ